MKTSQVIFNTIGLFIACMALVSIISVLFVVMPGYPAEKRSWWHFLSVYEGVLIITIGGGALANLAKGRLSGWPTGLIVAGYFMSVWLIPLGIWGIIALRAEQKQQQTAATKTGVPPETP